MRRVGLLLIVLAHTLGSARAASAQDPVPADTVLAPAETAPVAERVVPAGPRAPAPVDTLSYGPSPRGALLRSLAVPGWGQFAVGSHVRGSVYLAIGATSWGMLGKTMHKLGEAEDRRDIAFQAVEDSLLAAMAADPELEEQLSDPLAFRSALDSAIEADSLSMHRDGLVNARRQQRQDWIAYTLFFTFLNALDAYVAAHLQDFPAELDVERRTDGVAVGLRVRLPARRE